MKILGLTGSIATGKSTAARVFRARSIPVFDSDLEVHKFYDSQESGKLLDKLIPEAIDNGRVSRQKLSELISRQPQLLAVLEPIVHAFIRDKRSQFRQKALRANCTLIVYDIPLLFETGAEKEVDETLLISCSKQQQFLRAMARPKMTSERLKLIMSKQMPDAEKRKYADLILENNATMQALELAISTVVDNLNYQNKALRL